MKPDRFEEHMHKSQEGSGSAEDTGRNRSDQKNKAAWQDSQEKQNIAQDAGVSPEQVSDLHSLGSMSGRDDYAGNYNDDMNEESTNEGTER